jgi:oligopeptidase B
MIEQRRVVHGAQDLVAVYGWHYFTRTRPGLNYEQFCRRPLSGGPEEILLDENLLLDDPACGGGYVYAVAHVRGGGEGGRTWWLDGRLNRKRNTFTDFIAVADALAADGWAAPDKIVSRGLSAGGLLQGAVFSMAPRRWRAVVAEVPFVDCITTMLDPGIPLTASEWDEWGDPRDPAERAYLASYSPYDNVPDGVRPSLLVTGSLHDPRVLIHEPAKWVARLRATAAPGGRLLFRPELGAGAHVGPAGRYDQLQYEAEILAFILDEAGLPGPARSSAG